MTASAAALRVDVQPARGEADLATVRALFRAYADGLGVDLGFQGFEAELAGLPGRYAPPAGALLLARDGAGAALGCVGVRPAVGTATCELKRLYVAEAGRGLGVGRALALAALRFAAGAGYGRVVLDTMPSMVAAQGLYRSLGFSLMDPGPETPDAPSLLYFERRVR